MLKIADLVPIVYPADGLRQRLEFAFSAHYMTPIQHHHRAGYVEPQKVIQVMAELDGLCTQKLPFGEHGWILMDFDTRVVLGYVFARETSNPNAAPRVPNWSFDVTLAMADEVRDRSKNLHNALIMGKTLVEPMERPKTLIDHVFGDYFNQLNKD